MKEQVLAVQRRLDAVEARVAAVEKGVDAALEQQQAQLEARRQLLSEFSSHRMEQALIAAPSQRGLRFSSPLQLDVVQTEEAAVALQQKLLHLGQQAARVAER